MKLGGKKILLGITGSIAAFKTAELVRHLVKQGAEVKVVMTPSARDFVTPLTLATLSGNPVLSEFHHPSSGTWNNHVELGLWADAMVIAPVSAHTLSKLAAGQCPDLLSAVYLSARCPVFLAPAMDLDMFAHPHTVANINTLRAAGNRIIGPEKGELASGLSGEGRMSEPLDILTSIIKALSPDPAVAGKKILVTAGPTREALDPVRYISNHSSGKMGVAIAKEFALRGGHVTLIAGPGVVTPVTPGIEVVKVESAEDMYQACMSVYPETLVTIMAAAVADFTPAEKQAQKIKKAGEGYDLQLVKTKDILAEMGRLKQEGQFLAGFALETENELEHAKTKLRNKNLDLIVLNSMNDPGAGFHTDTNKITIIEKNNAVTRYGLKTKSEVAADIASKIISCLSS